MKCKPILSCSRQFVISWAFFFYPAVHQPWEGRDSPGSLWKAETYWASKPKEEGAIVDRWPAWVAHWSGSCRPRRGYNQKKDAVSIDITIWWVTTCFLPSNTIVKRERKKKVKVKICLIENLRRYSVKMCYYATQQVAKMENLTFKNNIGVLLKDYLDTVCWLFASLLFQERTPASRAFPLTWLSAILSCWMCTKAFGDHTYECVIDQIPRLTCISCLENIFFGMFEITFFAYFILTTKCFKINLKCMYMLQCKHLYMYI